MTPAIQLQFRIRNFVTESGEIRCRRELCPKDMRHFAFRFRTDIRWRHHLEITTKQNTSNSRTFYNNQYRLSFSQRETNKQIQCVTTSSFVFRCIYKANVPTKPSYNLHFYLKTPVFILCYKMCCLFLSFPFIFSFILCLSLQLHF